MHAANAMVDLSVPVGQPITIAGGPRTRTITVLVG
jgi:hypothetical protein